MRDKNKFKIKTGNLIGKPSKIIKKYDDNEQVKYDNELDTIPFKRFKAVEMNLFFSIVSQMRNKDTETVRFPFSDLRKLSKYAHENTKVFIRDLKNTYHKMLALTIYSEQEGEYYEWVLFDEFHISEKHKFVDISVNPKRKYILNNLSRWTRFSLQQFNSLKSSYAKTIFRLCKQFRTKGIRFLSKEKFSKQLDIPKSYGLSHIDERILKPSRKELRKIWPEFDYGKRKSKKRNHKLLGYYFIWKPEAKNNKDIVNKAYRNNFASDWQKKKASPNYRKPFKKENQNKIGVGKKVHKTSNRKASKVYKDFKDN